MDFALFESEWSAQEEVTLLKGISQSGIDNWIEISEKLSLKTAVDCEAHFYSFYYKSQSDPIPRIEEIGCVKRDKNNKPIYNQKLLEENSKREAETRKNEIRASRNEDDKDSETSKKNNKNPDNPISDVRSLVGYMPKRGDFDTEYDEEAETRI
jgi:transcriptional adapter 2-alpha